jgi:hypothetical protein
VVPLSTDRIADKLLRLFHIAPADKLYPFAGFKILVVLKKVLDLLERDSSLTGKKKTKSTARAIPTTIPGAADLAS